MRPKAGLFLLRCGMTCSAAVVRAGLQFHCDRSSFRLFHGHGHLAIRADHGLGGGLGLLTIGTGHRCNGNNSDEALHYVLHLFNSTDG